jgi:DNA-binding response OmpR family regulator
MKKILVTDDDPRMLELVSMAFETYQNEYEILTASNGQIALKMVEEHHPDLLILDLMMPNGHGYSVCREIRADRSLDSMRILVLSAKYFPKDKQEVLALGADEFMPKPFSLKEIVRKSQHLLGCA